MTCRRAALPPKVIADRKAEATEILGNQNATESLKRLAWRVLLQARAAGVEPTGDMGDAA